MLTATPAKRLAVLLFMLFCLSGLTACGGGGDEESTDTAQTDGSDSDTAGGSNDSSDNNDTNENNTDSASDATDTDTNTDNTSNDSTNDESGGSDDNNDDSNNSGSTDGESTDNGMGNTDDTGETTEPTTPTEPTAQSIATHEATVTLMQQSGLFCSTCHAESSGELGSADLDLVSGSIADFSDRLVAQPSLITACSEELLIDPDDRDNSLLLKLMNSDIAADQLCIGKMPLGSSGVSSTDYAQFVEWVDALIAVYRSTGGTDDNTPTEVSETAVVGDAFTVLNKAKYILHGSALTSEELTQASDSNDKVMVDELRSLIRSWMYVDPNASELVTTDEFRQKREYFLDLALQQNPSEASYVSQFGNTNCPGDCASERALRSLEESFIRTAARIADNGEDFRTLFTTSDIEVTTLGLLTLKLLDNPPILRANNGRLLRDNSLNIRYVMYTELEERLGLIEATDHDDWRTVRLNYNPSSTDMRVGDAFTSGENLTTLRALQPTGDEVVETDLRTPRLLCSWPSFFQKWGTNEDNEFRVVTNQCLIVALADTFSPGDNTEIVSTPPPGIDVEQFPTDSQCYGCHKNMDPMRSAFTAHFDANHQRYLPTDEVIANEIQFYHDNNIPPTSSESQPYLQYLSDLARETPYFSFKGYHGAAADLPGLMSTMVNHPDFALAWTLKLCQWGTSIECSREDPEIIRVATEFSDSGYQLNTLFEAFFSSQLVTHTTVEEESSTFPGSQVSIARRDHFCHALNTRMQDVREENINGIEEADIVAEAVDYCEGTAAVERLSGTIPDGGTPRGSTTFSLSRDNAAFISLGYDKLCQTRATSVFGNAPRTLPGNTRFEEDITAQIKMLTTKVLGFPTGTAQYDATTSALRAMYTTLNYDDATREDDLCADENAYASALENLDQPDGTPSCGLNLGRSRSWQVIWSSICQSPSLTGVGL